MTTGNPNKNDNSQSCAGLAGWLLSRLRGVRRPQPRLALLERITLAPRQSLSLVEADGRRFLIATSADGTPAFFCLDEANHRSQLKERTSSCAATRISW